MTGCGKSAPSRSMKRIILWCVGPALATGSIGASASIPASSRVHRASASGLTAQRVGWYAPHSPDPVLTSDVNTVPAGILLRLPAGAEVVRTSPLPGIPRLFVAPRYRGWKWPRSLHSGVDAITWQRALHVPGPLKLLGASSGRISASVRHREALGGVLSLELQAAVVVEASRHMDQILKGPVRPRQAANCGTLITARASQFRVQRTKLAHSRATALTISARGGKACYFARFSGAGTYLIQMEARSLAGSHPAFCVWSAPFGPCLLTWHGHASSSWQSVRKFLTLPADSYLYLYAPTRSGALTKVQFTAVHVWHVELPPRAAYIEESSASANS